MKNFVLVVMLFVLFAGSSFAIERVSNPVVTDEYVKTYSNVTVATGEIVVTPTTPGSGVEFITDGTFSVQLNATAAGYATDDTETMIRPGVTKFDFFPINTVHLIKVAGSSARNITIRIFKGI